MAVPLRLSETTEERVERRLDVPMLVVTLLMVPVFVLEGAHVGQTWKEVGRGLNWFVWGAFLVEAVVMLAVVPSRRRWLRRHPIEVAVIVLSPPFLPGGLGAIRVLRLLRLIRLLALWRYARRVLTVEGIKYAGLAAFMILVGGAVAFSAAEKGVSMWDGFWWSATTMTTVGYGDISPHTTGGRVIALVVMFAGIGFGTIAIAGLADAFVSRTVRQEVGVVADEERQLEIREDDIVAELRALRTRLDEIEHVLTRRAPGPG